jgi:hypothetical protein
MIGSRIRHPPFAAGFVELGEDLAPARIFTLGCGVTVLAERLGRGAAADEGETNPAITATRLRAIKRIAGEARAALTKVLETQVGTQ